MTQQNATNELPHDPLRIYKTRLFSPMSGEKRARLESYRATATALQTGAGLPHTPSVDALSMWARETGRVQSFIYRYFQQETGR